MPRSKGFMGMKTKAALVDWILEVAHVFGLDRPIYGHAVALLDQSCHMFVEEHRQIHAAVCVHMATEAFSISLSTEDIAMSCDRGSILGPQVFRHLVQIVSKTGTGKGLPTLVHFTAAIGECLGIPRGSDADILLNYFTEKVLYLSMTDPISKVGFAIAAMAILLSRAPQQWPVQMQMISPYSRKVIEDCMITICRNMQQLEIVCPELRIVDQKYSSLRIPSEVLLVCLLRGRPKHAHAILDS